MAGYVSQEASLDAYSKLLGAAAVERIRVAAEPLRGARIQHLTITRSGSHHARMLDAAVPLLTSLGLDVRWESPPAVDDEGGWSSALHRSIEGDTNAWGPEADASWRQFARRNASLISGGSDLVVVHDPQLLRLRSEAGRAGGHPGWIWHCHFDLRDCDQVVADLISAELSAFSLAAVEHLEFAGSIRMPTKIVIPPVIDPLSDRNAQLHPQVIDQVLRRFDLNPEWPLALEVSPFDGWDDPQWAFWIYEAARRDVPNLQLALVATAPSADDAFSSIRSRGSANIRLLSREMVGDTEINALQGKAVLAMQNAVRRGFSTSLLEAWWKGRPVVASEGGAIAHQVEDGVTGFLFATFDDAAERIVQLVQDPSLADSIGFNGHRLVRESHLVIQWVEAYLSLFRSIVEPASPRRDHRRRALRLPLHV